MWAARLRSRLTCFRACRALRVRIAGALRRLSPPRLRNLAHAPNATAAREAAHSILFVHVPKCARTRTRKSCSQQMHPDAREHVFEITESGRLGRSAERSWHEQACIINQICIVQRHPAKNA
eukprot:6193055-Pleurochrysis_carterae.AAC.3